MTVVVRRYVQKEQRPHVRRGMKRVLSELLMAHEEMRAISEIPPWIWEVCHRTCNIDMAACTPFSERRVAAAWCDVMKRARSSADLLPLLTSPFAAIREGAIQRLGDLPAAPRLPASKA